MLFQFRLQSLEKIEPWGGDKPSLSWFALTDSWYWRQVGSQELFRYSQAMMDFWANENTEHREVSRYDDYQIARPWEDMLQCLPAVLEPVPEDLIQRIADMGKWQELRDIAWEWAEKRGDEYAWDLLDTAFRWWSERGWDAGYLRHPPEIWFWTQGNTFHLRWDNRTILRGGIAVWEATSGELTLPVAAFVAEVRSFHERLMAAMAERVNAVCSGGLRPGIDINLDWLVKEQQSRSTWLTDSLNRKPPEQDWDKVREALGTIERMCYNNSVEGL